MVRTTRIPRLGIVMYYKEQIIIISVVIWDFAGFLSFVRCLIILIIIYTFDNIF